MANMATASTKFMPDPAASTMKRGRSPLLAKLPGSFGSSSPRMRTNAPSGIQFSE
jgi:hypothetical protein